MNNYFHYNDEIDIFYIHISTLDEIGITYNIMT